MKKILSSLLAVVALIPQAASAHVGYVTSANEFAAHKGADWNFLLTPFTQPFYLALMALTAVIVSLIYFGLSTNARFQKHVTEMKHRTQGYGDLVSWIMRLGLGILLIGAGTSGVLISPLNPNMLAFSGLQILLGFFILAGFLLGPSILVVIGLYVLALFKNFYIFGNLDVLALSVALLADGNPRPGVDDLLGIKLVSPIKHLKNYVPLFLRIGIGLGMMFLALYEKILNPNLSALVIQNYHLTSIIPVTVPMWVLGAGVVEFLVGLLLLIGFQTRLVVVVAFLVLSLSFFYFHEAVYSHVTLFSTLSVLFITGRGSHKN